MALSKKDLELIAQIASQAAIAAVAATGGAQAPSKAAEPEEPVEDEAAELAEIARQEEAARLVASQLEEAIDEILPLILSARHIPVLDWMAKSLGNTRSRQITIILRNACALNLNAYREAHGKGGSSTNNKETIAHLQSLVQSGE